VNSENNFPSVTRANQRGRWRRSHLAGLRGAPVLDVVGGARHRFVDGLITDADH
jgi:hypothetical protein